MFRVALSTKDDSTIFLLISFLYGVFYQACFSCSSLVVIANVNMSYIGEGGEC